MTNQATIREDMRQELGLVTAAELWMREYFQSRHSGNYGGYFRCRDQFYKTKLERRKHLNQFRRFSVELLACYK